MRKCWKWRVSARRCLQSRSVEFAAKYAVPVEVNSSFKEGKGTLVTREDADMEGVMVSGVTGDRNQAKITIVGVPDRPALRRACLGRWQCEYRGRHDHSKCQPGSMTDISFTVPKPDLRSCRGSCSAPVPGDRRPVGGSNRIHRQSLSHWRRYAVAFRRGGEDVRGAVT